jgi:hypothetical protein
VMFRFQTYLRSSMLLHREPPPSARLLRLTRSSFLPVCIICLHRCESCCHLLETQHRRHIKSQINQYHFE